MGNKIWFTSDQHFGHANIIKLMKRPFTDLTEMHEVLTQRHNKHVSTGDRVYHLGDFAWQNHKDFLKRLNGQHYLIKGNHDHRRSLSSNTGFIWIHDTENLKINEYQVFLSHYAHRVWPNSHRGAFHLYGHSHGMLDFIHGTWGRSMDVGVDANNFTPIEFDEIRQKLINNSFSLHHPE